jgi:RND family efflux transporter MFP subunit
MKSSVLFYIISIIGFVGCHSSTKNPKAKTGHLPEITVAHPLQQEVTYNYQYPAYLQAEQTVELVARVSGSLKQINYQPGEMVKKGQLLFVIEPEPYRDQVQEAEAQVKSYKAQLNYAQKQYEKMKEALPSKAISEIDFIQAASNYQTALANLQNAEANLNSARIQLNYCYIKAPFSGKISQNSVDLQNYVNGSVQPVTLATMYRDQHLYAYFNMAYPEFQQLPIINTQSTLPISISDAHHPERQWSGQLDYAAPNIDTQTGTVTLRASINNPNHQLLSGMYVKITIPYQKVSQALLVPESSIGTTQTGQYLYLVNAQNQIIQRMITTGILTKDNLREIRTGLTPEDRYVVDALMSVRPGMTIQPILKQPSQK